MLPNTRAAVKHSTTTGTPTDGKNTGIQNSGRYASAWSATLAIRIGRRRPHRSASDAEKTCASAPSAIGSVPSSASAWFPARRKTAKGGTKDSPQPTMIAHIDPSRTDTERVRCLAASTSASPTGAGRLCRCWNM